MGKVNLGQKEKQVGLAFCSITEGFNNGWIFTLLTPEGAWLFSAGKTRDMLAEIFGARPGSAVDKSGSLPQH